MGSARWNTQLKQWDVWPESVVWDVSKLPVPRRYLYDAVFRDTTAVFHRTQNGATQLTVDTGECTVQ